MSRIPRETRVQPHPRVRTCCDHCMAVGVIPCLLRGRSKGVEKACLDSSCCMVCCMVCCVVCGVVLYGVVCCAVLCCVVLCCVFWAVLPATTVSTDADSDVTSPQRVHHTTANFSAPTSSPDAPASTTEGPTRWESRKPAGLWPLAPSQSAPRLPVTFSVDGCTAYRFSSKCQQLQQLQQL